MTDDVWTLPERELVRYDEAARYAVVHEQTIMRWADHNIIKRVYLPNGQPRIVRESLLASAVVNEHLAMNEREALLEFVRSLREEA